MKRASPKRQGVRTVASVRGRTKSAPAKKRPGDSLRAFFRQRARMILGIALLAVFLHDVFGARGFLAMRRQQKEVHKLQQEIHKINEDNRELAEQVKALKTDPKEIERIAREQMGLARQGELIFKIPQTEAAAQKK